MIFFSHEKLSGEIDGKNRLFELKMEPGLRSLHLFRKAPDEKNFGLLEPEVDYRLVGKFVIITSAPLANTKFLVSYLAEEKISNDCIMSGK